MPVGAGPGARATRGRRRCKATTVPRAALALTDDAVRAMFVGASLTFVTPITSVVSVKAPPGCVARTRIVYADFVS